VTVRREVFWGWKDETGKVLIEPQFDQIGFFQWASKSQNEGKWGFIDKSGKMVIKPKYSIAFSFSGGLAKVKD